MGADRVHPTDAAVLRLHAEAIDREWRRVGALGPQIDLGGVVRAPMPFWLVDVANAALKLGEDEVLMLSMPRQSAHPIWAVVKS